MTFHRSRYPCCKHSQNPKLAAFSVASPAIAESIAALATPDENPRHAAGRILERALYWLHAFQHPVMESAQSQQVSSQVKGVIHSRHFLLPFTCSIEFIVFQANIGSSTNKQTILLITHKSRYLVLVVRSTGLSSFHFQFPIIGNAYYVCNGRAAAAPRTDGRREPVGGWRRYLHTWCQRGVTTEAPGCKRSLTREKPF